MTAKEMFEELGYELKNNDKNEWYYQKGNEYFDTKVIYFDEEDKTLKCHDGGCGNVPIDVEELKAIQKQVEELGWLDVKNQR